MNKKIISIAILLLVGLTACAGSATSPEETVQTQPETESATEAPAQPAATETAAVVESTVPATEAAASTESTSDAAAQTVSYAAQVVPIFEASCIKCHGVESRKEGLDMLTYDNLMAGSRNGPVLTPGNAADSLLVELIESGDMPNRGPGLSPEQIQIIKNWVNQGALNN